MWCGQLSTYSSSALIAIQHSECKWWWCYPCHKYNLKKLNSLFMQYRIVKVQHHDPWQSFKDCHVNACSMLLTFWNTIAQRDTLSCSTMFYISSIEQVWDERFMHYSTHYIAQQVYVKSLSQAVMCELGICCVADIVPMHAVTLLTSSCIPSSHDVLPGWITGWFS